MVAPAGLQAVAEVDAPAQHDFVADSEEGSVKRLLALDCVQDPGNLVGLPFCCQALLWWACSCLTCYSSDHGAASAD